MVVAVHPIKARIWEEINSGRLKTGMTYREIGKIIGTEHPQKVKHHLEVMKNMGTIDFVNGTYELKVPTLNRKVKL